MDDTRHGGEERLTSGDETQASELLGLYGLRPDMALPGQVVPDEPLLLGWAGRYSRRTRCSTFQGNCPDASVPSWCVSSLNATNRVGTIAYVMSKNIGQAGQVDKENAGVLI